MRDLIAFLFGVAVAVFLLSGATPDPPKKEGAQETTRPVWVDDQSGLRQAILQSGFDPDLVMTGKGPPGCVLDRKDEKKGYIPGNTILTCVDELSKGKLVVGGNFAVWTID
jgi:hypothetical protein